VLCRCVLIRIYTILCCCDDTGDTDTGSATTTTHLTILTILKSLSVGLMLVGDYVAANILLHTILPHIVYIDSHLYNVLVQLPAVIVVSGTSVVGTSSVGGGASSHGSGSGGDMSESTNGSKQVWALSAEQLNILFNALVN